MLDRKTAFRSRRLLARAFLKAAIVVDDRNSRPIYIRDDYTQWLSYAIGGITHPGNLYCFDYALSRLCSSCPILEIGSFCGLSTNLLSYYKRRHGRRNPIITCDKWQFEATELETSSFPPSDYRNFVRESYIRNIRAFSAEDLPYTVEMTSDEFFAAWRERRRASDILGRPLQLGGSFSFCFVDGNHDYEYVKRDFFNCAEFLEPGGFLFFDDSGENYEGVAMAMFDVAASKQFKLVARNPHHLFQKLA